MGRIGWTLSAVFIAAPVAGGMVFLSYSNDIDQAGSAVANGARIASTAAGPIEYAERATAFRSFPSTAQVADGIRA